MAGSFQVFLVGLIIIFAVTPSSAKPVEEVMLYKLWSGTEGRNAYQLELFELAMRKTENQYPAYVLTQNNQRMGALRGRREVAKGKLINFYVAAPRTSAEDLESRIISIPIPLLRGLLGYRKIIVRKAELAQFNKIHSSSQLQDLKAGQARGWLDVEIYKKNGYKIVDSGLLPELIPMLIQKRFDYLPLGIMEVEGVLKLYAGNKHPFGILPNLFIYYPMPAIFHVSASDSRLAKRLQEGLLLSREDGSMDELFNHHFSSYVHELKRKDYSLIVLKNPSVDEQFGLREPQLTLFQETFD